MNAIQTVQAVRQAMTAIQRWTRHTWEDVTTLMPPHVRQRGYTDEDWAVTVHLLAADHETPPVAAARLARYMTLHQERFNHTPTLKALQRRLGATTPPGR